jgi:uncharacterized protein YydD (DUF2326 family)
MSHQEPTNQDILDVLQSFAGSVDARFDQVDERFEQIESTMVTKDYVDKRFEQVDKRFAKIESTMVTKEYLDDKISDLRGDLVGLVRKEDDKVVAVIDALAKKRLLDGVTTKNILAMEPYAKG